MRPTTLNLEVTGSDEGATNVLCLGTSPAFDNLEDKDLFVQTFDKYGAQAYIPKSILIPYDVEEAAFLDDSQTTFPSYPAVLKTPLGSRGDGVFFVSTKPAAWLLIADNRRRAVSEKGFLEYIKQMKDRLPQWVLQAEVRSKPLLGGRKFHLRTYVIALENATSPGEVKVYVYRETEVRVAGVPMAAFDESNPERDRESHITNGACGEGTSRLLMSSPEMRAELGHLTNKLSLFTATFFGRVLLPEFRERCAEKGGILSEHRGGCAARFAIAGVDIMVDESENLSVLEVNANPAAPPADVLDAAFRNHLVEFGGALARLVVSGGGDTSGGRFADAADTLDDAT